MKFTQKHFFALDVATRLGIEIEVDGKTWTFSALRFKDIAKLAKRARSEALEAYEEANAGKPQNMQQRTIDLNGILFGTAAQEGISYFRSPGVRSLALYLSLRPNHKEEIRSESDVEKFFDDDGFIEKVIEKIELATFGPIDPSEVGETAEVPFVGQSNTSSASSTSSETSPDTP